MLRAFLSSFHFQINMTIAPDSQRFEAPPLHIKPPAMSPGVRRIERAVCRTDRDKFRYRRTTRASSRARRECDHSGIDEGTRDTIVRITNAGTFSPRNVTLLKRTPSAPSTSADIRRIGSGFSSAIQPSAVLTSGSIAICGACNIAVPADARAAGRYGGRQKYRHWRPSANHGW